MMGAGKVLVWFLSRNHRTIKAVKGPQEVSNQTSCPKQGQFWGQSRLLLPRTSRSLKLLRYRCGTDSQGDLRAASVSSWGNSLSFYPVCILSHQFIPGSRKVPLEKILKENHAAMQTSENFVIGSN